MKEFTGKEKLIESLEAVLVKNGDINATLNEFRALYSGIDLGCSLVKPFLIALIETESLRYSIFYQSGSKLSKNAIEISHMDYCAYLWKDEGGWCLDDDFYKPRDIAKELADAPLLKMIPENVKDLEKLLVKGMWVFSHNLPKYDGSAPDDIGEVLSWDSSNILTGTKLENISVISRSEWSRLTNNENHWFE
ncbi:hypothetical protein [Motilimonas pumila]|uniref:Uncharacterized protein n=1 Tax=Motilimonas pumila TaxID=2303987 RepID=A0A418YFR5_9GAMM|nr:hypothetical protein [Motilimonas pumila]RJG48384.1 hypothetical protein D1Z90_07780 [Motilimonas pumila]